MYFNNEYAVPVGWQKLSIGQICKKFTSGGTPSRKNLDFYINGTIPWVKTKELNDGYIADAEEFITEEALSNSSAKKLPKDTVLMAMYGATVGKLGILPFEAACNQACAAMVVDEEFSDFKFLFYLLKNWRSEIIAQATGAAQQNLSGELVRNFQFDFPPVEIQKAIGELLGALDEKIRVNQQIASTLEQIAQTIFKSWFVDFDPVHAKARGEQPVGMDAETAALFPDSFEECELGPVPCGWKPGTISELGRIATGKTPSTKVDDYWNGDVPFVTIPDLHKGSLVIETARYLTHKGTESQKSQNIPSGSTMVSCIATAGLVGFAVNSCQTNQQINSIIPRDFESREWVFNCMLNLRPILRNESSIGTVFANLSKSGFSQIRIIMPPKQLMLAYSELIRPLIELATQREIETKTLISLRDSLLPRLISGELEIPAELLEA